MKTEYTFATAYAADSSHIYVACAADIYEPFARFTTLYRWDERKSEAAWTFKDVDECVRSVTALIPDEGEEWWLCALSENGQVYLNGNGRFSDEKIPGAGVFSEDSGGWGYVADLQQIGDHLYVCGYKGQVYKRVAPNQWLHLDHGLLQDPDTVMEKRIALSAINGPDENAIYAVGYRHADWLPPCAFFWEGRAWGELALPPVTERLTNIYVEDENRIWMCGSNGTLLLGNAKDGFKSLSTVDDNQLFLSLTKFQDRIYLGSNLGLFVYDPANHDGGILEVNTKLKPKLQDANVVDAVDGVLWSIGPKDIARFNGKKWTRVDHPDNPPIR